MHKTRSASDCVCCTRRHMGSFPGSRRDAREWATEPGRQDVACDSGFRWDMVRDSSKVVRCLRNRGSSLFATRLRILSMPAANAVPSGYVRA